MNIWQIEQNLLNLIDELEFNGGELTPEIEQELAITQESFKQKVESYTNLIKHLNSDVDAIKAEQKRLKELSDSKQRLIEKLKRTVIEAIEKFGDTKKSGVKYLDYGTGEVSVRSSVAVDADTDTIDAIGIALVETIENTKFDNMLDCLDRIDADEFIEFINQPCEKPNGTVIAPVEINKDELGKVYLDVNFKLPASAVFNGTGYNTIKEIAKYTDDFGIKPSVDKFELKNELKENGAKYPHLARLQTNKSIVIK